LNSETTCPISFIDKEIKAHLRDGEAWNKNTDFWNSLQGFVYWDGWTSKENYKQAIEMFAELREQGLQILNDR